MCTGENPGAAGGTSSSRPAFICGAITPPARQSPGRTAAAAVGGGELLQLGHVPVHRLGQQAAERSRPPRSPAPWPGLVIVMSAGASWMVRIGAASS